MTRFIPDPSHVRFSGPLAPFAAALVEELARLGYTATSATNVVQLVAHLSRWLAAEGIEPSDAGDTVLERFLAVRRATYTNKYSSRALRPALGYLRREGLLPTVPAPTPVCAVDVLLDQFRRHLVDDQGLTAPVAAAYSHWVASFVKDVLGADPVAAVGELSAGDVAGFLAARLPSMTRKTAQMTACALRSFLRFLHREGLVEVPLADAVPAVAHRRLAGLPEPLTQEQIHALLGACDQSTAVGRRDYAVITVLSRLGLRRSEASNLLLAEVDWRAGVVTIRGKGGRVDRLPLPVDVGDAIVDYLRHGRPVTAARTLFVTAVAPHGPLQPSGLSCIVARAARRSGLGTIHAHRLRHTAASRTPSRRTTGGVTSSAALTSIHR